MMMSFGIKESMAIENGQKIKAICLNGEIYEGILYKICLGMYKEDLTQASIIVSEEQSDDMKYGHVHIFCNDLKRIEVLK